jgi:NADPH:quinone reductase-like Zn-dependent oxidoreductase
LKRPPGTVAQLQPGDEIFGASRGAFAEYVCVDEKNSALKPVNLRDLIHRV